MKSYKMVALDILDLDGEKINREDYEEKSWDSSILIIFDTDVEDSFIHTSLIDIDNYMPIIKDMPIIKGCSFDKCILSYDAIKEVEVVDEESLARLQEWEDTFTLMSKDDFFEKAYFDRFDIREIVKVS